MIGDDGLRKCLLVHRIVASCFIPNPDNLPEVNHKDKNKRNNHVGNLEWCSRIQNLEDSYSTMSPVRNTNPCFVYKGKEFVDVFPCIKDALDYCEYTFEANRTSLERYLFWGEICIVPQKTSRKIYTAPGDKHKTQNRKPVSLLKNGKIIAVTKTFTELSTVIEEQFGVKISPKTLRKNWANKKTILNNYDIVRE